MLEYYRKEGKGIQPEFDLSRMKALPILKKKCKQNLAALFLSSPEMEKIADAKAAYQTSERYIRSKKYQKILIRV